MGARVLKPLGRGAVAKANAERDAALARAEEAERRAEKEHEAAERAEQQRDAADKARKSSQVKAKLAIEEKEEYGDERYEEGKGIGYEQGRKAMMKQLEDSKATIRHLKEEMNRSFEAGRDSMKQQLDENRAVADKATKRAEASERKLKDIIALNPHMGNYSMNYQEMIQAGMQKEDIKTVFATGHCDVTIPVNYNAKRYHLKARVALCNSTNGQMRVWFNDLSLSEFMEAARKQIMQSLGQPRGPRL
jgi:hypothetical protein